MKSTEILLPQDTLKAAQILRSGELVAFPTETVYGLGARVFDAEAVGRIFEAKGRPSDNPLIVHCADKADLKRISEPLPQNIFALFDALYQAFCPGALTFVLPKNNAVPSIVSAGLNSVAVRFPRHSLAQKLIREVGEPLVAPSANRSGYPSPTTAHHVLHDLQGRIAAVLDGGPCEIGIESTVVNILSEPLRILRPGSITKKQLDTVALKQGFSPFEDSAILTENTAPASPGMKYRHYAPDAALMLVSSVEEALAEAGHHNATKILARKELFTSFEIAEKIDYSLLSEQTLYAALREADEKNYTQVIVVCDEEIRANAALMNRIAKAASKK